MKKIAQISSLVLLLVLSNFIYGQKTTIDSANVQIENKAEINLAIYSYKNLAENVKTDFKSLQSILEETKDIQEKKPFSINYEPNKSMTIMQNEAGEKIIWENGEQSIYQFNNQCNIRAKNYFLQIQFNELEELVSDSLLTQLLAVIDTTAHIQARYATTYNYSFEGLKLIHNQQNDEKSGQMDMLMLKGGVGVNLIKSEPVIDVSAEIAFAFTKKGILKNQYFLSYNLLFDFMEESTVNLNGFLNIGYRNNLSKNKDKPNWLGVEVGYLVNRQGDLFGKNTFKLGVNWELGRYVSVSPQLYMSGGFTELYPAVRIGFGF
jgi:hypothetical protein